MAVVRDMVTVFRNIFGELYRAVFQGDERYTRYGRDILIVVAVLVIGFGGFKLYRYRVYTRESTAQRIFYECLNEMQNVRNGIGSWYDVEVAFQMGYRQNSNSKLAPFFLAFQAEALLEQGKNEESLMVLSDAINKMSADSNMYWIFKTKQALVKMDMPDEVVQKEGLQELEKIACISKGCDKENAGMAVALFYLGSYYWQKDDPSTDSGASLQKAKDIWNKLVSLEKKDIDSPYIALAKEKLKQIS